MAEDFKLKDSGARASFAGGMVRDTTENKTNYLNVRFGPMLKRWATHLTKGREKYPDPEPGVPNWTLAEGTEEYLRFQESAARHFEQWLAGDRDEDHAAAVFFNINGAEYVRDKMGGGQGNAMFDGAAMPGIPVIADEALSPDTILVMNREALKNLTRRPWMIESYCAGLRGRK